MSTNSWLKLLTVDQVHYSQNTFSSAAFMPCRFCNFTWESNKFYLHSVWKHIPCMEALAVVAKSIRSSWTTSFAASAWSRSPRKGHFLVSTSTVKIIDMYQMMCTLQDTHPCISIEQIVSNHWCQYIQNDLFLSQALDIWKQNITTKSNTIVHIVTFGACSEWHLLLIFFYYYYFYNKLENNKKY